MNLHVRAELGHVSGMAQDTVVNTFNIRTGAGVAPGIVIIPVRNFYNVMAPGALVALGSLFSPELSRAANRFAIRVYDVTGKESGAEPIGSPVDEFITQFTPAASASGLPGEVAYALTLEGVGRADALVEAPDGADADAAPDRPRQRLTGRIYLGPLNTNCAETVDGIVRPAATIRDTAHLALVELADSLFVDGEGSELCVWSRKNASFVRVDDVSSDNAFDTMRSRGPKASLRTRVAVP
jgi:hypothetical protein